MRTAGRAVGLVLGALLALVSLARAEEEPGPAASAPAAPAPVAGDPWGECARAIAAMEPTSGLPPGLLSAIAMVESGRRNPETRQVQPWPWSWNAGGETGHAETRAEAAAAITAILEGGQRSIDVGCMQVNLLHHPEAFASVDEALDPARNVAYAIRFLHVLRARSPNWAQAIANYHSGTPSLGLAYHRRVVAAGRGSGMDSGAIELPARSLGGLCATGLRPVLVADGTARGAKARATRPRLVCQRPRVEYAMAGSRGGRDTVAAALRSVPGRMTPVVRSGARDPALLPLPPPPPSRLAAARPSSRPVPGIKK